MSYYYCYPPLQGYNVTVLAPPPVVTLNTCTGSGMQTISLKSEDNVKEVRECPSPREKFFGTVDAKGLIWLVSFNMFHSFVIGNWVSMLPHHVYNKMTQELINSQ